MIIAGAKGFAKEVLEVLMQLNYDRSKIAFFDNVTDDLPDAIYSIFPVLRNRKEVEHFIEDNGSNMFTLGIGNPAIRYKLYNTISEYGGVLSSVISPKSNTGHFNVELGQGINLMTGAILTNDIKIGKAGLINLNCTIGHDCILGDFVELSPGVHISGNCKIGNFCNIGTNATILPGVEIGDNVIIGANALVNKNLPSNCVAIGMPAKIIRELLPLEL